MTGYLTIIENLNITYLHIHEDYNYMKLPPEGKLDVFISFILRSLLILGKLISKKIASRQYFDG